MRERESQRVRERERQRVRESVRVRESQRERDIDRERGRGGGRRSRGAVLSLCFCSILDLSMRSNFNSPVEHLLSPESPFFSPPIFVGRPLLLIQLLHISNMSPSCRVPRVSFPLTALTHSLFLSVPPPLSRSPSLSLSLSLSLAHTHTIHTHSLTPTPPYTTIHSYKHDILV